MKEYDVIIIGAGAVGSAIAYRLSANGLKVCVFEKNPDVCFETSARNSGVVHAGFNNPPGSLKAAYCVRGSAGFEEVADRFGIPYKKTGKYVVALTNEDESAVDGLLAQASENGVRAEKKSFRGMPALYSPDTAITDPFKYTIALAEAAHLCGCDFYFEANVRSLESADPESQHNTANIHTSKKSSRRENNYIATITYTDEFGEREYMYSAPYIINCAGLGAAGICRLLGISDFEIVPCRGEYHIADPYFGTIDMPVYPAVRPGADVLGIHLTPTIDGNIMIGPSSEYLNEKMNDADYSTTHDVMEQLFEEGKKLLPGFTKQSIIRSFSGIRPKLRVNGNDYNDFLIRELLPGFIVLLGIESPGLTASFPIAEDVCDMVKLDISRLRRPKPALESFPYEKMSGASQQICRCESVTANEILAVYDRITSIKATPTLRGIKHRTRLGMGRCQGSFCTAEIVKLLRRERGIDPLKFTLQGKGSELFTRRTR